MDALIVNKHDDMAMVSSTVGCFTGRWRSSVQAELRRYILELDTEEILHPESIQISDSQIPHIDSVEGLIVINGFVVEVQDHVMVLKLDKTLLMIELFIGFDFSRFVNNYVRVKLKGIDLYDTGIC